MLRLKRVVFTTLLGIVSGVFSVFIITSPNGLPRYFSYFIIINRIVMGFAIGISCIKLPWWLHGLLLGALFSLPMMPVLISISRYATVWMIVMGGLYGVIIELITSQILKAKSSTA
ncbi:MAG: hypothetical protein ACETVX_00820 [bacterium]